MFTPFNTPAAVGFSKRLDLYLKDAELSVVTSEFVATFNSFLLNCHKLPEESCQSTVADYTLAL